MNRAAKLLCKWAIVPALCAGLFGASEWTCKKREEPRYAGGVSPENYRMLAGKKIFVDPGHGGSGGADVFRNGPGGISEEEVNLCVALYLRDKLAGAGATVLLSREKDEDVPLEKRVAAANAFAPDLLVSVHHNGTARRMDRVNYPCVLFWGSAHNAGPSRDLAQLLQAEFHKIMEDRGRILSDFSSFPETGTMILRETRYTCPGVIGEGGFFSDERHAVRLADRQYNQLEADAYFLAIAEFFRRGVPSGKVLASCAVESDAIMGVFIKDEKPILGLRLDPGAPGAGVDRTSVRAWIDGVEAGVSFIEDSLCVLDYGSRLYPGGHAVRFSFANGRGGHSPVMQATFTLEMKKGDFDRLADEGIALVKNRRDPREGLKMLLAAHSMSVTHPDDDRLVWHIAQGFAQIGDANAADYYLSRLRHCYPESSFLPKKMRVQSEPRMMVEYKGRPVSFQHEATLEHVCREHAVKKAPAAPARRRGSRLNEVI